MAHAAARDVMKHTDFSIFFGWPEAAAGIMR
jgi:hypothetical protein